MTKKLRLLLFAVCCISAMSLTSCLDNDDNSIDSATYKKYLTAMQGTYYGKIRFFKESSKANSTAPEKYDSITGTNWTMGTDSAITINEGIVSYLDSAISSKDDTPEELKQLQKAISDYTDEGGHQLFYFIPNSGFVNNTQISFLANPITIKVKLNYGEKDHDVYFMFYSNTYGGTWNNNGSVIFNMCLGGIYVDGTDKYNSIDVDDRGYFKPILVQCEGSKF